MTANPQRRMVIVDDEQIVTRDFTSIIEHLGVSVSVIHDSAKEAPDEGNSRKGHCRDAAG